MLLFCVLAAKLFFFLSRPWSLQTIQTHTFTVEIIGGNTPLTIYAFFLLFLFDKICYLGRLKLLPACCHI